MVLQVTLPNGNSYTLWSVASVQSSWFTESGSLKRQVLITFTAGLNQTSIRHNFTMLSGTFVDLTYLNPTSSTPTTLRLCLHAFDITALYSEGDAITHGPITATLREYTAPAP